MEQEPSQHRLSTPRTRPRARTATATAVRGRNRSSASAAGPGSIVACTLPVVRSRRPVPHRRPGAVEERWGDGSCVPVRGGARVAAVGLQAVARVRLHELVAHGVGVPGREVVEVLQHEVHRLGVGGLQVAAADGPREGTHRAVGPLGLLQHRDDAPVGHGGHEQPGHEPERVVGVAVALSSSLTRASSWAARPAVSAARCASTRSLTSRKYSARDVPSGTARTSYQASSGGG